VAIRRAIVVAFATLGVGASLVGAQGSQPNVTIYVSGPGAARASEEVVYRYVIGTDQPRTTVVLTWAPDYRDPPIRERCCEFVRSRVISGSGQALGDQANWWLVDPPEVVVDVTLRVSEAFSGGSIIVGGYITGTQVSQFLKETPAKTLIYPVGAALPSTGGPPIEGGTGVPVVAGLAAVLAGLTLCLVGHGCGRWPVRTPPREAVASE